MVLLNNEKENKTMNKSKIQIITFLVLGVLMLIDAIIYFNRGNTGLMIFFLVCTLIEFLTAIYFIVREIKQRKNAKEE